MMLRSPLPLTHCRILIVDDSPTVVGWRTLLRVQGGAHADVVFNARQARRHLGLQAPADPERHLPNIILLDFHLPGGVSGSQLAHKIRAEQSLAHIVRICVSGREFDDVIRGFDDPDTLYHGYIQKGTDPALFLSKLVAYFTTFNQSPTRSAHTAACE